MHIPKIKAIMSTNGIQYDFSITRENHCDPVERLGQINGKLNRRGFNIKRRAPGMIMEFQERIELALSLTIQVIAAKSFPMAASRFFFT